MAYNSLLFLAFLGLFIIVYFLVPKKFQWGFLLIASVAFYLFSGWQYIFCIVITTLLSWSMALKIGQIREQESDKKTARKKSKKFAAIAVIVNIGMLFTVKYIGFLWGTVLGSFIRLFEPVYESTPVSLVMPLGMSFYTFMAVGYVLDVYWGKYKPEKNLLRYSTFAFYFPHIIQGPISRFDRLAPQLFEYHSFSYERFVSGAELMMWGFFKKMVVADRLGIFVAAAFKDVDKSAGGTLAVAIALFSVQLYADFSGCIDMARGASEILGIDLEKNFERPYFSKTMPEFWRRWHITLFAWFKDYLLYPVSISGLSKKIGKHFRKSSSKRAGRLAVSALCLFVVWVCTGLWHGSSLNYVLWGLFHGILLFLSQLFEPVSERWVEKLGINRACFWWRLWQIARTFFLCCAGRIFFRSATVEESFTVIGKIITNPFQCDFGAMNINNWIVALLGMMIILVVSLFERKGDLRPKINEKAFPLRWALMLGMIFACIILGIYGPGLNGSNFIYTNF